MSINRIDPLIHVHGEEPPKSKTDWREAYMLFLVFGLTLLMLFVVGFTLIKISKDVPHQIAAMWRKP